MFLRQNWAPSISKVVVASCGFGRTLMIPVWTLDWESFVTTLVALCSWFPSLSYRLCLISRTLSGVLFSSDFPNWTFSDRTFFVHKFCTHFLSKLDGDRSISTLAHGRVVLYALDRSAQLRETETYQVATVRLASDRTKSIYRPFSNGVCNPNHKKDCYIAKRENQPLSFTTFSDCRQYCRRAFIEVVWAIAFGRHFN